MELVGAKSNGEGEYQQPATNNQQLPHYLPNKTTVLR
jgi:hypothetical protein